MSDEQNAALRRWVTCPKCGEPDMPLENSTIRCCNEVCHYTGPLILEAAPPREEEPDDDRGYEKLSASRDAYMKELHAAGLLPTEQIIKVSAAFARGFDAGYDAHPSPAGLEQARLTAIEAAAQACEIVDIEWRSKTEHGSYACQACAAAIRALSTPSPTPATNASVPIDVLRSIQKVLEEENLLGFASALNPYVGTPSPKEGE